MSGQAYRSSLGLQQRETAIKLSKKRRTVVAPKVALLVTWLSKRGNKKPNPALVLFLVVPKAPVFGAEDITLNVRSPALSLVDSSRVSQRAIPEGLGQNHPQNCPQLRVNAFKRLWYKIGAYRALAFRKILKRPCPLDANEEACCESICLCPSSSMHANNKRKSAASEFVSPAS